MVSKAGSLVSEFLEYVSFGVLSMIGVALFILADTYFVANGIGPEAIASLNVAIPVSNVLHGTGWLIGVGGATLYAIQRGRGNMDQANATFTFTVKFAAIVAVVLCTLLYVFNTPILYFFGASNQTIDMAREYYLIHAFFGPFFIICNTFISFVRNDNNPRLATIALLAGGFSNIILDYIFIYHFNWGMAGASFATILSPAITLLLLCFHLRYPKRKLKFADFKVKFDRIKRIVSVGFSSFLNEISTAVVIVIFNFTMLRLVGDIGVSAYGIVANINLIAILIFQGMGQGVQPLISRYFGMDEYQQVKKLIVYGLVSVLVLASVLLGIGLLFTDSIVSLFNRTNHQQMAELASQGIRFFSISFVFSGLNIMSIFILAAIEKARASMTISISRGLVLIPPVIFVLANLLGITGVWATMIVVELLTLVIAVILILRYWRKNLSIK